MRSKSEKKRQEIIAIATPHFLQNGYASTSVSDIAAQLGGSKATLYNYFPSKEKLFTAVILQLADKIGSKVFRFPAPSVPIRPTLLKFGEEYLRFMTSSAMTEIVRCFISETHKLHICEEVYRGGLHKNWSYAAAMLKVRMEQGELRMADPWRAAMQLKSLIYTECMELRLMGVRKRFSPAEVRRQVEEAVDMFLKYYAPDKAALHRG